MKICVSTSGESMDSPVDPRFGRAPFFAVIEAEGGKIAGSEFLKNPASQAMGGAGIQAAQAIVERKVSVLITGNVGPNAFQVLSSSGVKMITGIGGVSVKEAVSLYLEGELSETKAPTAPGSSPGRGMGMGGGMGQGRGLGRNR